ncbi:MAG: putative hydroxypyruvate isomerase [Pseudomonadota bacterium]
MPQFAANLSMMYNELPFLDRFEAAARDGFRAVEYLFPYAYAANELRDRLQHNGLQQVLFNAPPGGTDATSIDAAWAHNSRGTASVPGREAEFRAGFALALHYAQALACPRVHVMAGLLGEGQTRASNLPTYVANLKWAAQQAAAHGLDVLIEPINLRDIPGFFLNRQDHAHAVIEAVDEPNLKVQMDLYHCQIVEGDLASKIRQYLPTGRVGHFQIAGVPERHEPHVGEVHYPYVFNLIDELAAAHDWHGWIGCEYRPRLGGQANGTSAGLGWFAPYRAAP